MILVFWSNKMHFRFKNKKQHLSMQTKLTSNLLCSTGWPLTYDSPARNLERVSFTKKRILKVT